MSFNTSPLPPSVNEKAACVSTVWLYVKYSSHEHVYCTYGPVSPSNCTTSRSRSCLYGHSRGGTTAPTPTAEATVFVFKRWIFRFDLFQQVLSLLFNTPSRRMIFLLYVSILSTVQCDSPNVNMHDIFRPKV